MKAARSCRLAITLQLLALRLELGHFLARFLRTSAQFSVDFADGIHVPTQPEKSEASKESREASTR